MVRKNELTTMESVEFHCHIFFLWIRKEYMNFFLTHHLQPVDIVWYAPLLMNVNMLSVVREIEGA
jgi:hypothetical protein